MATSVTELPDAGPCRWCPHGQWSHKRGKGGCREVDCICDKYAVDPAAQRAEKERVLEAVAGVCEGQAVKARTELAEIRGELVDGPDGPDLGVRVGGFEPAQPGDVELPVAPAVEVDPAAQAEYAEQVAAIDAQLADPDRAEPPAAADLPMPPADFLAAVTMVGERAAAGYGWQEGYLAGQAAAADEIERLTAELEAMKTAALDHRKTAGTALSERNKATERVAELTGELYREQADHQATLRGREALNAEVLRLRDELDRANAGRRAAQDALDDAIRTGTAAASNVLYRYDGDQCTTEGCGSRYTVPVEHPHPLTPVTVLIVRREVPGA